MVFAVLIRPLARGLITDSAALVYYPHIPPGPHVLTAIPWMQCHAHVSRISLALSSGTMFSGLVELMDGSNNLPSECDSCVSGRLAAPGSNNPRHPPIAA